ncbi:hypothetical protein N9969_02610 [Akkermansiaceae bacterium]|nr:hypothetical protein [Akkermansiaceae bacterium]
MPSPEPFFQSTEWHHRFDEHILAHGKRLSSPKFLTALNLESVPDGAILTGANAATTAEHENGGTGDGYSNFVEYALGMDPTVVDSPYGEIVVRDTGFSVDFSRRKLDGVEVVLEWSSSLVGQWSTDGVTETVMSDDGDFEGIRATVPMDADKKFVRIRVTE